MHLIAIQADSVAVTPTRSTSGESIIDFSWPTAQGCVVIFVCNDSAGFDSFLSVLPPSSRLVVHINAPAYERPHYLLNKLLPVYKKHYPFFPLNVVRRAVSATITDFYRRRTENNAGSVITLTPRLPCLLDKLTLDTVLAAFCFSTSLFLAHAMHTQLFCRILQTGIFQPFPATVCFRCRHNDSASHSSHLWGSAPSLSHAPS